MRLFLTTFESVALLVGVGLLGFWVVRRRVLPESALDVLSPLALDVALPCLVFVNIVDNFRPAESPGWWALPLWWAGFMGLAGVLTALAAPLAAKDLRREFAISLFFPNVIFLPLALLTGMFGADSRQVVELFLFVLLFPSLFFGTYHLFYAGGGNPLQWRRIFNTVLIATVLAVTFKLSGAHRVLPGFLLGALRMVGATTLPVLMIFLGGSIYVDLRQRGTLYPAEVAKFVVVKNVLFPLVALGVLLLLRPSYDVALLIMIQSAVPPLTAVPVAVTRMGGNRSLVNQFMVASFAAALVTVPGALALFGLVFG